MEKPKISSHKYEPLSVVTVLGKHLSERDVGEAYKDMIDALINVLEYHDKNMHFAHNKMIEPVKEALKKAGCTE